MCIQIKEGPAMKMGLLDSLRPLISSRVLETVEIVRLIKAVGLVLYTGRVCCFCF